LPGPGRQRVVVMMRKHVDAGDLEEMAGQAMQPEFSRPLAVEDIGEGVEREVGASEEELAALARRMKLPAVMALTARLQVRPVREGFLVKGRMQAQVRQECVRTLELFDETLDVPVERLFVPSHSPRARALQAQGATVALEPDAPDAPDIIEDGVIDLGELVAEHLALALDPWPKKPGTDFVDVHAGGDAAEVAEGVEAGAQRAEKGQAVATDGQEDAQRPNPFAVLRVLKDRDGH